MLKMYFPFKGPVCKEEGNIFVNHRLRTILEGFILREYIYWYNEVDDEQVKQLILKLPDTAKEERENTLDRIIDINLLRKSSHFAKWLKEDDWNFFPVQTHAREFTSTLFGLYDILTTEKEYEPDWKMKYLLDRLINSYFIGFTHKCEGDETQNGAHCIQYIGRTARDSMMKEINEAYVKEFKDWAVNGSNPDNKPVTPEEMISYWEDIREYHNWIFENHKFEQAFFLSKGIKPNKNYDGYFCPEEENNSDVEKLYKDIKKGCAGHAPIPVDSPNGAELIYARYQSMSPQDMIDAFKEDILNKWPENRFPQEPDLIQMEQEGALFLMACDRRQQYSPSRKYAQEQIINRLEYLAMERLQWQFPLCFKVPDSEKLFKAEIKKCLSIYESNIKKELVNYDYRYYRKPEEYFQYRLNFVYDTFDDTLQKAETTMKMAKGMAITCTKGLIGKGYTYDQMKEIQECVYEGISTIMNIMSKNKLADGVDVDTVEDFLWLEHNDMLEYNGIPNSLGSVRKRLKAFKQKTKGYKRTPEADDY